MYIAKVTGNVTSTIKQKNLTGSKLLLTKKIDISTGKTKGNETIAVDVVGAGLGDRVLIFKEGGSAKIVLGSKEAHVAQIIVGIVDEIDLTGWKKV